MAKTQNVRSHRVLEKTGMRFERAATIYGMDVVCYSLSRDAHLAAQAARPQVYDLHCFSHEAHWSARLQV
jgi:hypothetical protein